MDLLRDETLYNVPNIFTEIGKGNEASVFNTISEVLRSRHPMQHYLNISLLKTEVSIQAID